MKLDIFLCLNHGLNGFVDFTGFVKSPIHLLNQRICNDGYIIAPFKDINELLKFKDYVCSLPLYLKEFLLSIRRLLPAKRQ